MNDDKISPILSEKLAQLRPAQQIRVLVMLGVPETDFLMDTRPTDVLAEVDAALARTAGQRLSPQPNALGVVAVSTNAAGLRALAALPHVAALMPDQKITRALTDKT